MNTSDRTAANLVGEYLDGRSMDRWLFGAVVWMVEQRLALGLQPVLDERLRMDIDSQARVRARAPAVAPPLSGQPS